MTAERCHVKSMIEEEIWFLWYTTTNYQIDNNNIQINLFNMILRDDCYYYY